MGGRGAPFASGCFRQLASTRRGAWGASQQGILAALADTFVPGPDAPRRAALAAERIDRNLEGGQARQLRWVLRAMDTRLANLLLTGRPVRLTQLDPRARERYLAGWAASRIGRRRDAFHAFRRLLTFLAYADPGSPGSPNPRLVAIGYEAVEEPATSDPTMIRALPLPPDLRGVSRRLPVDLEADVVVVGSGAGAGVVALEAARAGRSVLVLEAGPLVTEPDMPRDELAAFDRLYLQGGFAATWDGSIQLLAGAGVGGGTTVNWATCVAPPGAIRAEWATRHGLDGFDGAETDRDLVALSAELQISPPPSVGPKDAALLRGARAIGFDAGETERNAAGCGDCGSCGFGCPRGAKRSTLRVHLREAAALGARILPGATVDQVTISAAAANGVIASVVREDGSRRQVRVRAPQVVVAAGALRTPGILERSSIGHAALGRFLRIQPVSAIVARYPEPIEMWRGTMQAARSLEFAPRFTIESAPAHPGILASALPWTSAEAHRALMSDARFYAPLIAITRDTDWGRVTPLRSGGARVDYRLAEGDAAQLREALVAMARIAEAAGASAVLAPGEPLARWDRPADGGASDFRPTSTG